MAESLIPPLNFATIVPGVFRSGFPNVQNFPFMSTLHLRSILYLCPDEYKSDTLTWARRNDVAFFHFHINSSKEPFVDIDTAEVTRVLETLLDSRNLPALVHDNKGRLLPSVIGALLRRLVRWSFSSALQEYRLFLPDEKVWTEGEAGRPERERERWSDIEFIDTYDLRQIEYDPQYKPDWLED